MIELCSSRRKIMKKIKSFILLSLFLAIAGCSMHRVDVYQGNFIETQRLENLSPGMSQADVQLLLGTPLVRDVYDTRVWYYVFYHSTSKGKTKELQRLRLHFDENGRYQYYDGDITPEIPVEDISVTEVI